MFLHLGRFWDGSALYLMSTFIAAFVALIYSAIKNKNLPPGPWGFPYLGYWPFLTNNDLHLQLQDLTKKYGDVYSFTVTGRLFIHLGTVNAIKEAHLTNADCFKMRNQDFNILNYVFKHGIVSQNGESWKILRKFFNQAFKECGMSTIKDTISYPIYGSIKSTVEYLHALQGEPVDIVSVMTGSVSQIVRRMMFRDGKMSPEELLTITQAYENLLPRFMGSRHLLTGNFAKYLIFPLTPGFMNVMKNREIIVDMLGKVINRHKETRDGNHNKNLTDCFLQESENRRKKGDVSADYFTDDVLIYSLVQFTGDGVLDLSLFICYFLKALVDHPEEQENIYEELKEMVGLGRQPVFEDKPQLPYTSAFISEVTRASDFFNFFPSLECTKETTLKGYRIPKGSITLMNMWAAQHDPRIYVEPYKFNPSRYLSQGGKQKLDSPVIFGIGKRACNGEAFTMNMVFLFVTAIVINFRLSSAGKTSSDSFQDRQLVVCALPRIHE